MKQNTKNLVGIRTLVAAGFLLAKQLARRARAFDLTTKVYCVPAAHAVSAWRLAANSPSTAHVSPFCARDQSELEHVVDEFAWMGENFLAVTRDVTVTTNRFLATVGA